MVEYPRDPRLSADGFWWWDGHRWVPARQARGGGISTGAVIGLIAGGVVLVLVTVSVFAFVAFTRFNASATPTRNVSSSAAGVPCDGLEHTQVHYHAAIQILNQGKKLAIPTTFGRAGNCYYWLHMHSGEAGIIHIEAPSDRAFTLGDFFQVWASWSGQKQLLDSGHVSTITLTSAERLAVFVATDGGGAAQPFTGDPRSIVLEEHEVITLEITPPTVSPPPDFVWPPGF